MNGLVLSILVLVIVLSVAFLAGPKIQSKKKIIRTPEAHKLLDDLFSSELGRTIQFTNKGKGIWEVDELSDK